MSPGPHTDPPPVVAPIDAPKAVASKRGIAHFILVRHRASWIQLFQYSVVGASGAIINLLVNHYSLREIGSHHIWTSSVIAFLVANVWNYLINRWWTFGSHGHSATPTQYSRFLAVGLVSLVGQLLVLTVCVRGFGWKDDVGQLLGIVFATPLSFVGNKLWTFRVRHV